MPQIAIADVDVFRQTAFGQGEELISDATGTYEVLNNVQHWSLVVPDDIEGDLNMGLHYIIRWGPDPANNHQWVSTRDVYFIGVSGVTGMARFAYP